LGLGGRGAAARQRRKEIGTSPGKNEPADRSPPGVSDANISPMGPAMERPLSSP